MLMSESLPFINHSAQGRTDLKPLVPVLNLKFIAFKNICGYTIKIIIINN